MKKLVIALSVVIAVSTAVAGNSVEDAGKKVIANQSHNAVTQADWDIINSALPAPVK